MMNKLRFFLITIIFVNLLTGCQTVKEKTDNIVQKENEKLSEFIGKSLSELKMELGKPDEDFKNAKGNFCLLYTSPSPRDSCASRMPSSA